jgi:hypothetical protein
MHPLASAGAVTASREIAAIAHAKVLFMSSSREPTFRWFQNIVEGQKFHRDDRLGAARGSRATRATRATRRDAN